MVAGYTPAERMVLRDLPETAELNDKCEAHLNDGKHLTTKRAIKFALRMVGRGADSPPEVAYGVGGWDALVKSLGVRDRLMHPKVAQDLEVTDRELEQVRAARTWFITNYRGLQEAVYETAMAENHREMQEWADGKLDECADEQDG
jgi:hypothetical protein